MLFDDLAERFRAHEDGRGVSKSDRVRDLVCFAQSIDFPLLVAHFFLLFSPALLEGLNAVAAHRHALFETMVPIGGSDSIGEGGRFIRTLRINPNLDQAGIADWPEIHPAFEQAHRLGSS